MSPNISFNKSQICLRKEAWLNVLEEIENELTKGDDCELTYVRDSINNFIKPHNNKGYSSRANR